MGALRNARQLRAVPNPIGLPAVSFRRWEFGNMRPWPMQVFEGPLTNTTQVIASIFIPPNTWALNHRAIHRLMVLWNLAEGHDSSTLSIDQYYQLDDQTPVNIGSGSFSGESHILREQLQERELIYYGTGIYDTWIDPQQQPQYFKDNFPSQGFLQINDPGIPFDNSVSHYIKIIFDITGALSGDAFTNIYGKAYVEAPLQLNRLPR